MLLLVLAALCGCSAFRTPYYKIVTTNVNGELISSWVSKGRVWRSEGGYVFRAVQRQIEHPPTVYRYPLGWRVRIAAPCTIIYRTEKPAWLEDLTPLDVADAAEDGGSAAPPVHLGPPLKPAADRAR
jgi:hypothetical protein